MEQDSGGSDRSFESRLQAARIRQGLDAPPPKPKGDDPAGAGASPWAFGARLGVEMVSALVVALAIGYGLDWACGTKPWIMIGFVPLGVAAGIANVWRLIGRLD